MSIRNSRREFLRRASQSLAIAGISSTFYDVILGRILQAAVASESGAAKSGYNYVHLSLPGGPPRWFFDLPLTPGGQTPSNFIAGGFGTILDGGKAVYSASKVVTGGKSIYLPPVWNMGLANQRFTDLLPNTVFIRGLDMEINNHPLSNARQVAPIIGGLSISGVMADSSFQPIPSIVDTNNSAATGFRSKKGLANSTINFTERANNRAGENPITNLLTPFAEFRTGRNIHTSQRTRLQEQALAQIEAFGESRGVTANALPQMYENAMELIDQKITSAAAQWVATVDRYRAIISEAIRPNKGSLPGIFDKAVATTKTDAFNFAAGGIRVELADMRDMMDQTTSITKMAEGFAVMEILLDTVTSTFTLGMPPFNSLRTGTALRNATHDQHDIGSSASTMITTLWYRAFLGCLTEFTSRLKARNVFDRTIIHISAEFNRTPKTNHAGSDHGYMAGNTTLITGMVNQNVIMGNIKKDYNSTYRGTFGVASDFTVDGSSRPIQVNDVALTITSMLGVKSVVTNGRPLLKPDGNVWIPKKSEADNV